MSHLMRRLTAHLVLWVESLLFNVYMCLGQGLEGVLEHPLFTLCFVH